MQISPAAEANICVISDVIRPYNSLRTLGNWFRMVLWLLQAHSEAAATAEQEDMADCRAEALLVQASTQLGGGEAGRGLCGGREAQTETCRRLDESTKEDIEGD